MKPYACLTVCLLLALAVVLTPSPGASAFSIHPASTGSYVGGLGALSPRADSLHEAWRKPLTSTFWRRRRRGSTYRSPGSSAAERSLMAPRWGFSSADDEGSYQANHWKTVKQEKLRTKSSRFLRANDILGFSTPSKLHMRDPFEEAAASRPFSKGIRHPSLINEHPDTQHVMPLLETSSTDDGRINFYKSFNDRSRDDVEDFEDVAEKIREAIDMLAESKRVREKEEEEREEEYGAHAELPAGPVPNITIFPSPDRIPPRPVQNREPAGRHEEQSEKGELPTLLQKDAADLNDPLLMVNKAASKPSDSESLDLGTRMELPKPYFSDFETLFQADPGSSKGKGRDLDSGFDYRFDSSLGGVFDDDTSDCANIETKTCSSDAQCSCNGFYRCQQRRCVLRSRTHDSDLTSGVGDFSDLNIKWNGRREITRKKRQQPVLSASAVAEATATKGKRAGKEHVATDHSDSQTAASHSSRKRTAQAGSDDNAVHAARAAADVKGAKRRVPTGDPSRPPASSAQ